jgi:hypothetical protein
MLGTIVLHREKTIKRTQSLSSITRSSGAMLLVQEKKAQGCAKYDMLCRGMPIFAGSYVFFLAKSVH